MDVPELRDMLLTTEETSTLSKVLMDDIHKAQASLFGRIELDIRYYAERILMISIEEFIEKYEVEIGPIRMDSYNYDLDADNITMAYQIRWEIKRRLEGENHGG